MQSGATLRKFIAKWSRVRLPERAASQEHFIDLCRLLGQPTPAEHDATGTEYTFEKGVAVTDAASAGSKGVRGFADVWWRGKFAWEYKRKDKYQDLTDAYRQLCQYREALENPPLLIVSDIARIQIHTNFTGTRKEIHEIRLEHIAHPDNLAKLRRIFTDPHSFKPTLTTSRLTENAAAEFAKIADQLRQRKHDPHDAAHFLMKCMFCLFAEDVKLLPANLFSQLLDSGRQEPDNLTPRLSELFRVMRDGGNFGVADIKHFNGGLFDDAPALPLRAGDIHAMLLAGEFDWGAVEPSIFGTLFERSLDPSKRSQIGAHYTSREDIMLIVDPVVMAPLRREWEAVQAQVEKHLQRRRKAKTATTKKKADAAIEKAIEQFLDRLGSIRILDPACGSGNFLYVAIQELLALEKDVIVFASRREIGLGLLPRVRPTQLYGIEINPYAAELAQVVVWIGYLQWLRDNGFLDPTPPILDPLQTIECRDAILELAGTEAELAGTEAELAGTEAHPTKTTVGQASLPANTTAQASLPAEAHPTETTVGQASLPANSTAQASLPAEAHPTETTVGQASLPANSTAQASLPACPATWPKADFIIGNPPFLGSKLFRQYGLEEGYIKALYSSFDLPNTSDLCCYWFELARQVVVKHPATRVGLLATQGIRGGDNRKVLERIKQSGDIFMAWSDREWILDGAAVHVSLLGFDSGRETSKVLDGYPVDRIHADLTKSLDFTTTRHLKENADSYVRSPEKGAKFEITFELALRLLKQPNPNGRPTSDVLHPWINGQQLVNGRPTYWIIDFHRVREESEAAAYEAAYEQVRSIVYDIRRKNRDPRVRENWWRFRRSGDGVREAATQLTRLLGTTMVAKHRLFAWIASDIQPDKTIPVFARSDDYFFGVLHSSIHELWALRMGTQLEDRPRYTPTTCFETFPLPWPTGKEPAEHDHAVGRASVPA
ncbi:MAG: class I SAM-dependent DNA methyltransferase, partial [Phycisphaerae bacterium]|nr:class I SAM-dependent DNA methyltransferase [Phycisphaerae bacterium]